MQGRKLGHYLHEIIERHNLPPIEAVYSSPMVRCCMTAGEAIVGLNEKQKLQSVTGSHCPLNLKVTVEAGLVESLNEKWYRSWCLPHSDGTWGGGNYENGNYPPPVDENVIDPRAKVPAHELCQEASDVANFLSRHNRGHYVAVNDESIPDDPVDCKFTNGRQLSSLMNLGAGSAFVDATAIPTFTDDSDSSETKVRQNAEQIFSIQDTGYKWGTFESRKDQQNRMERVVEELSRRHSSGTILLVSHGGPVTHLYERLTLEPWESHGISSYTSFSVYQKSKDAGVRDRVGVRAGEVNETNKAIWSALEVNNSNHLKEMCMDSSDQVSSFV